VVSQEIFSVATRGPTQRIEERPALECRRSRRASERGLDGRCGSFLEEGRCGIRNGLIFRLDSRTARAREMLLGNQRSIAISGSNIHHDGRHPVNQERLHTIVEKMMPFRDGQLLNIFG